MAYNGWSNRETWLVNVWFNPECREDVDFAREVIEDEVNGLSGFVQDMVNLNAIDWDELKSAFQSEENEEEDY